MTTPAPRPRRLVSLEDAKSNLRAVMARGMASALMMGIDQAEQEGHALTELQKKDLATMAVMAYADAVVEGESCLEVEDQLLRALTKEVS